MTEDKKRTELADNLEICSTPDRWAEWFEEAEASALAQWDSAHWPRLWNTDMTTTLELAPGAGRNAERLKEYARTLYLVDLNDYALDRCRARFADYAGPCDIRYVKTDGTSLPGIEDESVTCVFSWDSMVHMDRTVVGQYLVEFARVMKPGARGVIHHSNHGARSDEADIQKNPHMRSNESAEHFLAQAEAAGLEMLEQLVFEWDTYEDLDCISEFRKPPRRS
ncbi:MAG: class I SAM-dependent methyltransferase [Planctomycetota bacterium]